jgi:choline dehydrogenase
MTKTSDADNDDGPGGARESTALDDYQRGEFLNALSVAAYTGRIDRRTFLNTLLKAGIAGAVAAVWADHAALAAENQTKRRADLRTGYDYIIVGAGAAGCVLANRLSADPSASVLVIEAGPGGLDQPRITDPFVWFTNIGSDLDWARLTVPQSRLDDRTLLLPAGRVVGGSSSINGTVWLRGDERDYDAWAKAGGPTWGFDPARRAFTKIEDYSGEGGSERGRHGPIPVGRPAAKHPLSPLLLRAAEEIGLPRVELNERPQLDGTGYVDENVDPHGRRVGAAQAYLLPALARPNLTLLILAEATGLLFAGHRCRGVSVVYEGRPREFAADRDVVLCAGAFGTPKLLLLSGIGPADELRKVGIRPWRDLPIVGQNLQDHVLLGGIHFPTSRELPPPVANGIPTVAYLRTNPPREAPNVQLVTTHFAFTSTVYDTREAYVVWPAVIKPTSRGRVRLASADPTASLLIDPNYLGTAADRTALQRGLEWALEVGNARALDPWRRGALRLRDLAPDGPDAFIESHASTYFHHVGTCAFGRDPGRSVVNAQDLRVWGIDGLRVTDASAIPEIPSVNTHVPVLILAELAAEMIMDTGRGGERRRQSRV